MKKNVLILVFIFTSFIASSQAVVEKTVNDILEPEIFKEMVVGKDVQLVDVRTSNEYNSGHIDDAYNIDYFDKKNFTKEFEKFDKYKPLYIYCRSGNRSQKSARILEKLGFKEIHDLKGGMNLWNKKIH